MKIVMQTAEQAERLVKRMAYLAWKASRVAGAGILQDRGDQTEDEFWKSAIGRDDYGGAPGPRSLNVYCDYVNGRMMKWGCNVRGAEITIPDFDFKPDYQSFCHKYESNGILAGAALDELDLAGCVEAFS